MRRAILPSEAFVLYDHLRSIVSLPNYMAAVVGLEPTKYRSQSPVPYHLATPQYHRAGKGIWTLSVCLEGRCANRWTLHPHILYSSQRTFTFGSNGWVRVCNHCQRSFYCDQHSNHFTLLLHISVFLRDFLCGRRLTESNREPPETQQACLPITPDF